MRITADSLLGLKRHFIGTLISPSPVWLKRAEGPQVGFSGEDVEEGTDGCTIDFGLVERRGEPRRIVRIENLGQEVVSLTCELPPPWLRARWAGDETTLRLGCSCTAELELTFCGEAAEDRLWTGGLGLRAEAESGRRSDIEIAVRARFQALLRVSSSPPAP